MRHALAPSLVRFVFAIASALPLLAQEPVLRGFDPVDLAKGKEVAGKAELAADHDGQRYLFATDENRTAFLAAPERHAIQMGGACARMGPLSGRGDPQRWHVHGERIYVFASDQCREAFKKRPDTFLPQDVPAPRLDAAASAAAKALVDRAVAAHGGAERLRAWRTASWQHTGTNAGMTEHKRVFVQLPDHVRFEQDYAQGASVWRYAHVVAPGAGFFDDNGKGRAMGAEARIETLRTLRREPLVALRLVLDGKATAAPAGKRTTAGHEVEELAIWCEGANVVLGLGDDGTVRTARCRARGANLAFGDLDLAFLALQDVGGLKLPATVRATFDGKESPALHEKREPITVDSEIDAAKWQSRH